MEIALSYRNFVKIKESHGPGNEDQWDMGSYQAHIAAQSVQQLLLGVETVSTWATCKHEAGKEEEGEIHLGFAPPQKSR